MSRVLIWVYNYDPALAARSKPVIFSTWLVFINLLSFFAVLTYL